MESRRAALEALRDISALKVRHQLEEHLRLLAEAIARDREYERERDEQMERTFE